MPRPASETYTLKQFVADLDRITQRETAPEAITAQIAPLLSRLVKNPDAIPAQFRGRAPDGGCGRFMLHRETWAADGRVSPLVSSKYANC